MKRFVVIGLPRSGTTYLMTLLNAHSKVFCNGEQYNPYGVVNVDDRDNSYPTFINRDSHPLAFFHDFFETAATRPLDWAGFKFMVGHNIEVLKHLETDPDITLLYVWRENKLAQVSSMIKALETNTWAQTRTDANVTKKIDVTARQLSHRIHEYATYDHLMDQWMQSRPNPRLSLEYCDLFAPGFNKQLCDFMGLAPERRMKSPLVKQGQNNIRARFQTPGPIVYYFNQIGKAHWLDAEI
jgi:LPS sulfotransferase NodH